MRPILFLLLLAGADVALAQEVQAGTRPTGTARYGGAGFFLLTGQSASLDGLNDELAKAGFARAQDSFIGLGGGGYFRFDRVIVGGEGMNIFQSTGTRGGRTTEVSGGYGLLNAGYVVVDAWPFTLYPLVGFGIGGIETELVPEKVTRFSDALDDPRRAVTVATGGLLASAGVGADFMVLEGKDEKGSGGMIVGLRAGYLFSPVHGSWAVQGNEVSGGPDVGLDGFFVRLAIGGGGFDLE